MPSKAHEAATNRTATDALRAVFVDQMAPALAAVPDHAAERAALTGSQLLGLRVPPRYSPTTSQTRRLDAVR
ncbi:hypothetical protein [Mycobacterium sp.]